MKKTYRENYEYEETYEIAYNGLFFLSYYAGRAVGKFAIFVRNRFYKDEPEYSSRQISYYDRSLFYPEIDYLQRDFSTTDSSKRDLRKTDKKMDSQPSLIEDIKLPEITNPDTLELKEADREHQSINIQNPEIPPVSAPKKTKAPKKPAIKSISFKSSDADLTFIEFIKENDFDYLIFTAKQRFSIGAKIKIEIYIEHFSPKTIEQGQVKAINSGKVGTEFLSGKITKVRVVKKGELYEFYLKTDKDREPVINFLAGNRDILLQQNIIMESGLEKSENQQEVL
ncbi:MAG: hypothetical protein HQK65_01585 [Desulfamplus sp.]|nr:hypothetical protein [Desulfamplus sp.]